MIHTRWRRVRSFSAAMALAATTTAPAIASGPVTRPAAWLTPADHSRLLVPVAVDGGPADVSVTLDPGRRMQRIDGFGFALTGGSALLLQRMAPTARHALLLDLFGRGGAGVSWLRVSIGASDMDDHVFSYDDLAPGQSDPGLAHFSLAPDDRALIPTLREILAIAPDLPILASPWSPPAWMKTNGRVKGGTLRADMGDAFARYLLTYLRGMAAHGVPIAAITIQNEPENANNTPSMLLTAAQEAALIADHVGPIFRAAGLPTGIVAFDHNADHPQYPLAILDEPRASPFVAGTGFHLYEGDASALSRVHDAHPDKRVWLTEQMVIDDIRTGRATPLADPLSRVVLASLNNWASGVLLWNLAADPGFGPHTPDGGCTVCEGAVTIEGDRVTLNVAYAAIAQVARFVAPGSRRIGSTVSGAGIAATAFATPDGALVAVIANPTGQAHAVAVGGAGTQATYALPAGAALTVRWPAAGAVP